LRLALCQINATVGDIDGNVALIRAGQERAGEAGADLVLFPELALTGYPPEDLLLRDDFLARARSALEELAEATHGPIAIVGFPERAEAVYNAAAVLADGRIDAVYRKVHLPNYGVFDERRYFQPGTTSGAVIDIGADRVGLTVCEDMWEPGPPTTAEALGGAALVVNISASPYHAGKGAERERLFAQRARDNSVYVAFCALVGGQDELVFDGHSFVVDHTGRTVARAAQFREELLLCDVDLERAAAAHVHDTSHSAEAGPPPPGPAVLSPLQAPPRPSTAPAGPVSSLAAPLEPVAAEVYAALSLGLRDYVEKNGFARVLLGLSGGIDSALVACLAADALGAERVSAAVMPSRYSSNETQRDARALADALGISLFELPLDAVLEAYLGTLDPTLAENSAAPDAADRSAPIAVGTGGEADGKVENLTEENLQARIRGNLLMAISNRFGWLVLTTGNKSEMSVGYTTLYGDLAGGFAVIKDVPKTLVYQLARWRNTPAGAARGRVQAPIPVSIIERAPTAELRPNQRDQDSLPPYELLDRILQGYIEGHEGREQLVAAGLPQAEVEHAIRLVDAAEYKRRQSPPGIKVTERAFGRDRRMPITNRYRG
jgi:NAD+ synthase (glutamine-hydrolysing)